MTPSASSALRHLTTRVPATEAINMDGAISTQLIATAPGHRLDVRGERGTINAVVLQAPEPP